MVQITFQLEAETDNNEIIFVTGNHEQLGYWKPNRAVAMRHVKHKYSLPYPF